MYFLGIDVSTTATKALLIDPAGQVISVEAYRHAYAIYRELYPALTSTFGRLGQL